MSRRVFLRATLAGGASLLAGRAATLFAAASANNEFHFQNRRRSGGESARVWRDAGHGRGHLGLAEGPRGGEKVLRRAVELGVNLIDTADAYGPETNELLIAEALYPYPKGLVIATKGGNTRPGPGQWVPDGRPEYLKKCVDDSLKRLRAGADRALPIAPGGSEGADGGFAWRAQGDARRGKIRHLGFSEVDTGGDRARAQNRADRDGAEPLQSCGPKMGERARILRKGKIGFMPWAPVGGTRDESAALEKIAKEQESVYQIAIAWLLHRSPVMLPIPGTSSVAHLEENMAARKIQLTAEEWKTIDAVASQT